LLNMSVRTVAGNVTSTNIAEEAVGNVAGKLLSRIAAGGIAMTIAEVHQITIMDAMELISDRIGNGEIRGVETCENGGRDLKEE